MTTRIFSNSPQIPHPGKTHGRSISTALSPILKFPSDLEKDITVLDYSLPTLDELELSLDRVVRSAREIAGVQLRMDDDERERVLNAARGLTCIEAENFFSAFDSTAAFGDEWLDYAMATYRHGSPTTARVFMDQMRRAEGMTLADMFRMELVIAYQCIRHSDFPEGIRALLIDKDRNPKWAYKNALDVPDSYVEAHFEPVWSGDHPLAALGR